MTIPVLAEADLREKLRRALARARAAEEREEQSAQLRRKYKREWESCRERAWAAEERVRQWTKAAPSDIQLTLLIEQTGSHPASPSFQEEAVLQAGRKKLYEMQIALKVLRDLSAPSAERDARG